MQVLGIPFELTDTAVVDGRHFPDPLAAWAHFMDRVDMEGRRRIAARQARQTGDKLPGEETTPCATSKCSSPTPGSSQ